MKDGYRLSMTKGGRSAKYAFGDNKDLYEGAKNCWHQYRDAWRKSKTVSDDQWSCMLEEVGRYKAKVQPRTASDRIRMRWDTVPYAARKTPVSFSGRVLLVTVCRHRGVDLNIENGIADITLCHRVARQTAKQGDLIVGITAVANSKAARPSGANRRWPPVYHAAINAAWPNRRITWMAVATGIVDEHHYHADCPYGMRRTIVYKGGKAGQGSLKDRTVRKYHVLPKAGRNGRTIVSESFVRYPSNLDGAPTVPSEHCRMYERISLGRDRVCPPDYAEYYLSIFEGSPECIHKWI